MSNIKNYKMLINGNWFDAEDGQKIESINPHNKEVWATFPNATKNDVNKAVESAQKALEIGEWSQMNASQRGKCLRKLGDLLIENANQLGLVEAKDTGKLLKETEWQAKYVAEYYYFYAGCADKICGETLPIDKPDLFVYTSREPLGVVAAIIPWNSQLFLSAVKIGPALAAGNTMVIKLSEHASAVMLEFGRLIKEAGIPDGVVNFVTGLANPCGEVLTSHPKIKKIAFTGGELAAKAIIKNSQYNLAPISLELGGKSPIIVFDDADVDSAVNGAVSGIFAASGQSCVAGSRLLLHNSIADEFLAKMKNIAENITIGDPCAEETEVGPLCTIAQLEKTKQQVDNAINNGGKLIYGGQSPKNLKGIYWQPTIIECPNNSMEIVHSELFSPVVCVLRFDNEQQAIELANDSELGLAAGIFSKNGAKAMRVSQKVQAGIVWVNTYRAISPVAAFGGYKKSGYGRESGMQSVYSYTQTKTVWINTSDAPLTNQFVAR